MKGLGIGGMIILHKLSLSGNHQEERNRVVKLLICKLSAFPCFKINHEFLVTLFTPAFLNIIINQTNLQFLPFDAMLRNSLEHNLVSTQHILKIALRSCQSINNSGGKHCCGFTEQMV